MDTIFTGAAFGASIVASGLYQPNLVAAQFSLSSWKIVQIFLAATGSSALVVELLRQSDRPTPSPRAWSPLGLLNTSADGNILGGLLLGTGMALSSACPSIIFPQLALGVPTAPAAITGAVVGGVFWSVVLRPWISANKSKRPATTAPTTLPRLLGLSQATVFLIYEALVITAVTLTARPSTASQLMKMDTVRGGLLIGCAQVTSLVLRGSMLGVSTCYEQSGDWIVYLLQSLRASTSTAKKNDHRRSRPDTSALLFVAAMVSGAWGLVWLQPALAWTGAGSRWWSMGHGAAEGDMVRAAMGGFLMAVGSRMAGGCPTGHGISGMALMSVPSMVTMGATFAAAFGVTAWLKA